MDVSIIIVNWNTCKITCECLQSVYEQTVTSQIEVIVIDNGSTDESVKVIKEKFPQVILIENTENRGFAAANNQGIRVAKGRYLLFLNTDTLVLARAIDKTVSFADARPEAAVIGCRVLNPDHTLQPTCFMFPSVLNMVLSATYLYKLFPNSRFFGRERMTWWLRDDVREVDVVTGCFMLVRREAITEVGMMDEQFFMYGEETDWCYRFKRAGWQVIFTPVGKIIHCGRASSRQQRFEMILQLRESILLFMKKHKSFLSYTLACLFMALFFFLRVPYWLVRAVFSSSRRSNNILIARTYLTGVYKALLRLKVGVEKH